MSQYTKGCIYIVLSAVIFGCMPLAGKVAFEKGFTPFSLITCQNAIALPLFLIIAKCEGASMRVTGREYKQAALLGIAGGSITPALLYSSYRYIEAGAATTLHFVYPLFVLVGCVLLFREKAGWLQSLCAVLCTVGILLFYQQGSSLIGQVMAALSGVTYAAYILYLDKSSVRHIYQFKRSFYMCATNAGIMLLLSVLTGQLPGRLPGSAWLLGAGLAVFYSVGAVVLFQKGTFIVGSQKAAIFSALEPVVSIAISIAVIGDVFSFRVAVGAALILCAGTFLAMSRTQEEHIPNEK